MCYRIPDQVGNESVGLAAGPRSPIKYGTSFQRDGDTVIAEGACGDFGTKQAVRLPRPCLRIGIRSRNGNRLDSSGTAVTSE